MRLQDALDRYVVQLQADGRSPYTIVQYERHIGVLVCWLGEWGHDDEVDAITHEVIAEFLAAPEVRASKHGGLKKATSMNALRSSLRAFFGYVHAAGWARQNPARLVRRARCSGPPPRGLSDQDRKRLLDTLAAAEGPVARRDNLLFDLLLATGLRLSAALALTDADVDLERGEILVRHAKGDRVEVVILGQEIRDHLVGYLADRPPGPLFAVRPRDLMRIGNPMSRRHAARRLAVWMERAGCTEVAHPHRLRSDFAGRLLRKGGGDILLVQHALHHRSILSTMRYVACHDDRLRAALG